MLGHSKVLTKVAKLPSQSQAQKDCLGKHRLHKSLSVQPSGRDIEEYHFVLPSVPSFPS